MHTPEYYMGRIERMLDDLLDTQPHRDDLRQNIYDSYVNLAESRDDLLAACKAALEVVCNEKCQIVPGMHCTACQQLKAAILKAGWLMAVLSPERIAEIRQMLAIGSKDFEFMRDALVETLDAHDHWLKAVRECDMTHIEECPWCQRGGDVVHKPDCPWLLSQEGK